MSGDHHAIAHRRQLGLADAAHIEQILNDDKGAVRVPVFDDAGRQHRPNPGDTFEVGCRRRVEMNPARVDRPPAFDFTYRPHDDLLTIDHRCGQIQARRIGGREQAPGRRDGIGYPAADPILYWLVRGYTEDDLLQSGFDAAEVAVVHRRLSSTHWKRELPTVAMLSSSAIGAFYLRPVDY